MGVGRRERRAGGPSGSGARAFQWLGGAGGVRDYVTVTPAHAGSAGPLAAARRRAIANCERDL
jgi:hypothetical protein